MMNVNKGRSVMLSTAPIHIKCTSSRISFTIYCQYGISVFSLAKTLKLILVRISATHRWFINKLCSVRQWIVFSETILPVHSVFVISEIIEVLAVISWSQLHFPCLCLFWSSQKPHPIIVDNSLWEAYSLHVQHTCFHLLFWFWF